MLCITGTSRILLGYLMQVHPDFSVLEFPSRLSHSLLFVGLLVFLIPWAPPGLVSRDARSSNSSIVTKDGTTACPAAAGNSGRTLLHICVRICVSGLSCVALLDCKMNCWSWCSVKRSIVTEGQLDCSHLHGCTTPYWMLTVQAVLELQ